MTSLVKTFSKLFNNFNFYTDADGTHGQVTFPGVKDAANAGLAVVQDDVRPNAQLYNSGLFIADFHAMPFGCSIWPAHWTVGPDWPNGGEMDIIEGVNLNTDNQIILHTGPTCSTKGPTGNLVGSTYTSSNGNNNGCAFTQSGGSSFGHQFNTHGGGVFAHNWDRGISAWCFLRGQIPQDITSGNPDSSFVHTGCVLPLQRLM